MAFAYGTSTGFTVTNLHSLASSSTRVAGWTSAAVDNTSTLAVDYLINGKFTLSSSAPTDGTTVSVYAYGWHASMSAGTPDLFSSGTEGTQGTATVHDEEERDNGMRLLWVGRVDTSTSAVHTMPPTSLALAFGGVVPEYWALWVVQNTGQALAASGNELTYTPVTV